MKYINFFRFIVWVIIVILAIVLIAVWRNHRVSQIANNQPLILVPTATAKPAPTPTPSFVPYATPATPAVSTITTSNLPTSGPAEDGVIASALALVVVTGSLLINRRRHLQTALRSVDIR